MRIPFFVILVFFNLGMIVSKLTATEVNIIDRKDMEKKEFVKNLKESENSKLKNYNTFQFYYNGNLMFCHISKDPKIQSVICH